MAKKRKVKRKVKRVRARTVKARAMKEVPKPVSAVQAEHILGLVGGILVIIAAIISIVGMMDFLTSVISLICGALMIILVYGIQKKPRVSAIFLLVLSILTLIMAPHGFIIGPILGLIGAIIVLGRGR